MTRTTGRSDIVDIACEIRAQTERAIQIFDGKTTCWIPRSQVLIAKLNCAGRAAVDAAIRARREELRDSCA